ncbi:MAG: VOC family protein [Gammaproteobacteria bacterium]|nr:VOC family protein [Gammaproteobacteria bacterium]
MTILALGYLGVNAESLADWADFGTQFLGLQAVDKTSKTTAFRMDDRRQRLYVEENGKTSLQYFGWEMQDAAALQAMAARLEAAGVAVYYDDGALAQQRFVRELIWFLDPGGNRIELFHGAETASEPFRPGRNIGGFRTGAMGLGHAVLTCESLDDLLPFYTQTLGFGISDYVLAPFKAYFLHVNPRHHSLALVETGQKGVHHLMMELMHFDDVGHAYDLAQQRGEEIGVTLGRHTNDYMTSFYTYTPSKFMVEYGWGGREINPEDWQAEELTDGPSIWGHNRSWLSDEANAVARALQKRNADNGLRQPVQVLPGNHVAMPADCGWWESLKRDQK